MDQGGPALGFKGWTGLWSWTREGGSPTSHGGAGEQKPGGGWERSTREFGMTSSGALSAGRAEEVGCGPGRSGRPVLVHCAEDMNSLLRDER